MYETIREGKAIIRIKKAGKVSKEMDVFYNPAMKLNRDMTILLLQQFPQMSLCDPLAASGIRSIRFAKELRYKSITANDYSTKAVNSMKNNLKLNKINNFTIIKNLIKKLNNDKNYKNKKITIYNEDANLFLLKSSGFDYIDIDPFGSSNSYLDASIKRISRNGILAVTNTDTAALTGTYPDACIRKYWALPKKDYMMHETGLRILIRKIQLVGMQYEKALIPIFAYFKDHYFRIFFRCIKGKKLCDEIARQHGMLNDAGPLWIGSLWDGKLVDRMHSAITKKTLNRFFIKNNKKILLKNITTNNQNDNELLNFLKIIKEESKVNAMGFFGIHQIAKDKKMKIIMKKEEIIKKIKREGFKAANTHFSGTGIRSDIPYDKLLKLLKE